MQPRYVSCSKLAALHEYSSGLSLRVDLRILNTREWSGVQSWNNLFVGFLEALLWRSRVDLESVSVAKATTLAVEYIPRTRMRRLFERGRTRSGWRFHAWFGTLNEKSVCKAQECVQDMSHQSKQFVKEKCKKKVRVCFLDRHLVCRRQTAPIVALCFPKPGGKITWK